MVENATPLVFSKNEVFGYMYDIVRSMIASIDPAEGAGVLQLHVMSTSVSGVHCSIVGQFSG